MNFEPVAKANRLRSIALLIERDESRLFRGDLEALAKVDPAVAGKLVPVMREAALRAAGLLRIRADEIEQS